MKRNNSITTPLLALLIFVIACNCNFTDWVKTGEPQNTADGNSAVGNNAETNTDANSGLAVNQPLAEEKTGIAECDEFITYIEQNSEEIGKDSMIVRGIVEYYKQMIFSQMREGIANSTPAEKEDFARQCREALKKIKEQTQKPEANK